MHTVNYNIKQIRILKNLTQEYMAQELGMTTEWYGKMENGKAKIDIIKLDKIAKILNVDPEDFFTYNPSVTFQKCNQKGAYIANNKHFSTDKEIVGKLISVLEKISARL